MAQDLSLHNTCFTGLMQSYSVQHQNIAVFASTKGDFALSSPCGVCSRHLPRNSASLQDCPIEK